MKRLFLATLAVAASLPAAAQFQKPEDAVKYRKAVMTVMANHFGRVGAMVAGRAPYDAAAKKLQDEMVKLQAAAKGNNLDTLKAAFGPVGQACKGCHDDFRNP